MSEEDHYEIYNLIHDADPKVVRNTVSWVLELIKEIAKESGIEKEYLIRLLK